MKAYTEYLTLNMPSKMAFVNITPQVEEAVRKSGVSEGLVLCNSMHITSSVFINDDERSLHHDFGVWLEQLAPFNIDPNHYHHNRTGEDNADAHLKRQVRGARSSWGSPRGGSTSRRGSRSSTASSTATAPSACK
jgi:secondary thiamine-phosphate synthase enzyme